MFEVLSTAILTAALTLGIAYVLGRRIIELKLAPLVQAEVDRRLEELGELIENRVRNGVVHAVEEVTSPESFQKSMAKGQDTLMNALFGKKPS